MNENDYKKLNEYLNGCFKELEKNDSELLSSLKYFITLSEAYISLTNKYELRKEDNIEPDLSFEDIFLLSREIIESINPLYLEKYDKLIISGELDFSYNNDYFDSHYKYINNSDDDIELININLGFNYNDVCILVHEFMHKMNCSKKTSINRYLLTEFISIYFEEYARNCLLKKGIEREKLCFNYRLLATSRSASTFNWYSLILLVYEDIGKIDENSYKFLNDYYLPISKEDFEDECKKALHVLEKEEKKYKMDILYEEEFSEDKLYEKLVKLVNLNYRYLMGTVFAFYALENCDIDKMVYLNDHINDDLYAYMPFSDILKVAGIDIENIEVTQFMDVMENKIRENGNKVK